MNICENCLAFSSLCSVTSLQCQGLFSHVCPPGASATTDPSDPRSKTGPLPPSPAGGALHLSVCACLCAVLGGWWCPYPQCPVPVSCSYLGTGAQDVTQPTAERHKDTNHHIHYTEHAPLRSISAHFILSIWVSVLSPDAYTTHILFVCCVECLGTWHWELRTVQLG